jgi:hypothetical protein
MKPFSFANPLFHWTFTPPPPQTIKPFLNGLMVCPMKPFSFANPLLDPYTPPPQTIKPFLNGLNDKSIMCIS